MTIFLLLLGLTIALAVVSQTQRLVGVSRWLRSVGAALLGLVVAALVFAALTALVDALDA